jgi:hypothetical protein
MPLLWSVLWGYLAAYYVRRRTPRRRQGMPTASMLGTDARRVRGGRVLHHHRHRAGHLHHRHRRCGLCVRLARAHVLSASAARQRNDDPTMLLLENRARWSTTLVSRASAALGCRFTHWRYERFRFTSPQRVGILLVIVLCVGIEACFLFEVIDDFKTV